MKIQATRVTFDEVVVKAGDTINDGNPIIVYQIFGYMAGGNGGVVTFRSADGNADILRTQFNTSNTSNNSYFNFDIPFLAADGLLYDGNDGALGNQWMMTIFWRPAS